MGHTSSAPLVITYLGEVCLLGGRLDEATSRADRALAIARKCGQRGHEAWALRLQGEIASHRDPPDVETAERHYHQALALATELAMRPLVAHCHLGLGTLYVKTGQREPTQEHLTVAIAMYREMDMGFWLEKAEGVLVEGATGICPD